MMAAMSTSVARNEMNARLAWLILALIMAGGMMLRLPGVHWLSGAADAADFSFHPDDKRFVLAASDIKAPIPDGYPQGMTTQLYLVHLLVGRFTHAGLLQILHGITIFYAGLLILLTYVIARTWEMSRGSALLAAAFLSIAPLAVVQSNFGTADVTAAFYLYAALLAGGQYLRTQRQLWFVVLCVLTGMAIAVKFFVPLFAPLALVLLVQRKGERLAQWLSALFIVAGSFEALSFFKFAPWDMHHLFWMLRDDNLFIANTHRGPITQLRLYSCDFVSAVGIPVALLFVVGVARWSRPVRDLAHRLRIALRVKSWQSMVTPASLFVSALSLHALLIVIAKVHGERHLLVFLPVICVAAAQTLFALLAAGRLTAAARALAIGVILLYQTGDAVAIESLYPGDVRNEMASWTVLQVAGGKHVIALMGYSNVRGTIYTPDQTPSPLDESSYVVTCDLEFTRYLHQGSVKEVFHPHGGEDRLVFFQNVFEGTSDVGIVREFRSKPRGAELRLIDANVMASLGTMVPRRCYALGRSDKLPPDAQMAIRAELANSEEGW
jgi:4-amino-4-deoxy-L-arabinose transferase-like glycosyltransferase